MGKKSKNAAERKDVFYKRAKEQGYRARSAFKLVHLNNIHGFLKKSKVVIDLCAAPGSWMQVAREYMPKGSVIVGVDLYPIKPIPGTIAIKGDITTESLRSELRGTLKEYKADVVLHDGAPKVGTNWAQDSYDQNILVLHAFKLACEFLVYGGDFITKVFRCKDSASLEYIFRALFKRVECTKPQASRYESAEIFYVCRHFKLKTGEKADPKFFDPKEVFKDVNPTTSKTINLHKPEKLKKKAEGYEDDVEVLYKETTITDFVECDNYAQTLAQASALTFDDEKWLAHPTTNQEIIACCEDIKVLGRKEIRMLLSWRKRLRKELDEEKEALMLNEGNEESAKTSEELDEDLEEDEVDKVMKQCEELQKEAMKEDKKKAKAIKQQKKKLQQSMRMLQMSGNAERNDNHDYFNIKDAEKVNDEDAILAMYDRPDSDNEKTPTPRYVKFKKGDHELDESGKFYRKVGDVSDSETDDELPEEGERLFKKTNLKKIDGIEIVPRDSMNANKMNGKEFSSDSETDDDEMPEDGMKNKKSVRFADDVNKSAMDDGSDTDEETRKAEMDTCFDSKDFDEEEDEDVGESRYTTDLVGDDPEEKKVRSAESWFSQDVFEDLDSDAEEDLDVDMAIEKYKKSGGKIIGDKDAKEAPVESKDSSEKRVEEMETPEVTYSANQLFRLTTQSQLSTLTVLQKHLHQFKFPGKIQSLKVEDVKDSANNVRSVVPTIESVDMSDWGPDVAAPVGQPVKRAPELDAVGLALAAQMIKTKKTRREFELSGWNRYMKGEEPGLPEWFQEDEAQNMLPMNVNVDPKEVDYYKARDVALNARSIKKVMEARVRKQRRFKKTMMKVIKKTEAMQGSSLLTEYEKQQEIKNLYKKALKTRAKKDTTYVVMTKKNQGKAPKGMKGRYKLVDPRMKKDVRAKMKLAKKKKTIGRGKKK